MIRTIWWEDDGVHLLDQRALPGEEIYLVCRDYREVIEAISSLAVRGAPALGVAVALGIALGLKQAAGASGEEFQGRFEGLCREFARVRPTARNPFWAIERIRALAAEQAGVSAEEKTAALIRGAVALAEEDAANNRRLGEYGQTLIPPFAAILTYCNAGALATAGYGTALGIVRAAWAAGKGPEVYACETRPVLQGARLTTWELRKEGIPVTLITDNMAGSLLASGKINCVIVGADRIARNGDTANKIGTYTLAVLARENGVPFYVAAPLSTCDGAVGEGREIVIEERSGEEVTTFAGTRIAPAGVSVWNPAFDITPCRYISAIVTERGIIGPPYKEGIERQTNRKDR